MPILINFKVNRLGVITLFFFLFVFCFFLFHFIWWYSVFFSFTNSTKRVNELKRYQNSK